MAESIVSDIAVELISKLGSLAFKEIGVCWGLKDELDKLKQTVGTIEAVLLHAEEQSLHNPQLKHWLGMLSEALYDADDLLDEFSTETLQQHVIPGSEIVKKVRIFFSSSNQLSFGLKMGHKVRDLRERLDDIAAEKNKFHLEERSVVGRHFEYNGRDQTHSSPPKTVIGREQEKEALVDLLLCPDYEENVSVIPIVGIGGLGKTTLAQLLYNDDRITNYFELKMWVYVSDAFDVHLLVKNVLEAASGQATPKTQMDILKNRLHEKINGRRYLLVLDDVWNEDVNKWLSFKELLAGGARGSKIMITTRLRKVAEISRPIFIHDMKGLFENESWSLFSQMAFKRPQQLNPSLEAMGKDIVKKCCGVPLAIKTIGGVLYFKDLESEWLLFKHNELSKIDVYKHDILPILRLSYNHLPSHYKHCFAYCSLYPKHYEIPVAELIQQWKAQGYLKSTNPNESLRDVGFEYFMDLYRLSFFQDVKKDDFGNIKYCKLHDLMHDLAVSVAGDNFCASHSETRSIPNNTLHVSLWGRHNYLSRQMSSLLERKKIRTILTPDFGFVNPKTIDAIFYKLKHLRVLDLSHMGIVTLPYSIYKLKLLRHLDLSHNSIKKLPSSLTNLYNLQVLKLQWCTNLVQFPSNMTRLVNLTDFSNGGCRKLSHIPKSIGKLTQLETLSEFVIANDHSISKHIAGLDELNSLNNLSGELEIKNLRHVKNVAFEYADANLCSKQKLQKLALYWGESEDEEENDEDEKKNNDSASDVANEEMGMEALRPHPNLKELVVSCYRGVKHPSWLLLITNLVSIRFENCRSIQQLPPLDQLPHLKKLWVWGSTKLEHINVENGGGTSSFFPSLTHLTLIACPELKGFKSSTQELPCFPCLSLLRIRGCANLTYLPDFPELKRLYLDGDRIKWMMGILKTTTSSTSAFSKLPQLQRLEISNMEDPLEDELLQYLPSLQSLSFWHCSFTTVCSDEKDDGMQWHNLKFLRSIEFQSMQKLIALPKGLQHATTLQHLQISYCHRLACIPEWMPKLIAIQDLTISMCGMLEERCKNNMAEDWPKISHIPNISINSKTIQRNGCYLL